MSTSQDEHAPVLLELETTGMLQRPYGAIVCKSSLAISNSVSFRYKVMLYIEHTFCLLMVLMLWFHSRAYL